MTKRFKLILLQLYRLIEALGDTIMAIKPVQYATERSFRVNFSGVIPSASAK